ncbi:hypothetical protein CBR_g16028 [Chara braunii]|uniref:Uncharacterized protein n=1 Tax=Chara braunii TaxID=69332 RepID=A0A388JSX7_CHABU|nr:hypothetical protein CBR_g16028 [Chara braunii]|eukprot:GBG60908.1 hypothetical protein CBR_g16028 [Chara braunii]
MGGSSEVGGSQKAGTGLMVWASTMTAVVVTATLVRLVHVVRGFITSRDAVYDPPQAILVLDTKLQRCPSGHPLKLEQYRAD